MDGISSYSQRSCARQERDAYHQEHIQMQQRLNVQDTNQDRTKAEPAGLMGSHVSLRVVVLVGAESDTL